MRKRILSWIFAGASIAAFAALAVGARGLYQPRATRELTLVARGMAFRLEGIAQENPEIGLTAGERVILRFRNEDAGVDHELSVPALGIRTRILEEGEEDFVELVPSTAGRFLYLCALHPGMMRGALVVAE